MVLSQLSVLVIWYYHILQDYCLKSSVADKVYSFFFTSIFVRCEIGRLNYDILLADKKCQKSLKQIGKTNDSKHMIEHKEMTAKLKVHFFTEQV